MTKPSSPKKLLILLANSVFILSLFPYVTILKVPWDTQPWALLAGVLYTIGLLLSYPQADFPLPLFILFITTLYGLSLSGAAFLFGKVDMYLMLRRMISYMTLVTVAFVSFHEHRRIWSGWLILAVLIWGVIAIMQKIWGIQFWGFLLPRVSSSIGRGVVSLAPEPSYYAVQCGFFLILNDLFREERRYGWGVYVFVLSISILQSILSLSATSILIIIIFIFGKALAIRYHFGKILALFTLIMTAFSFFIMPINLSDHTSSARFTKVLDTIRQALHDKDIEVIFKDRSIAYRTLNPVLGFYGGLMISKGVGFGWGRVTKKAFPKWLLELLGPYRYSGGKPIGEWRWGGTIMGGLVSMVYELGAIGLLSLGFILGMIYLAFKAGALHIAPLFILIALAFGGFVSIAHPLFGYLVGLFIAYARRYGK